MIGYNDHPFDLVPQLTGGHYQGISNIIGSVLHAGYVFAGSEARSPHTLPYQGQEHYLQQMPGWYQNTYKGIESIENGVGKVVSWSQGKTSSAYDYVDSLPSRIRTKYKLFRK